MADQFYNVFSDSFKFVSGYYRLFLTLLFGINQELPHSKFMYHTMYEHECALITVYFYCIIVVNTQGNTHTQVV